MSFPGGDNKPFKTLLLVYHNISHSFCPAVTEKVLSNRSVKEIEDEHSRGAREHELNPGKCSSFLCSMHIAQRRPCLLFSATVGLLLSKVTGVFRQLLASALFYVFGGFRFFEGSSWNNWKGGFFLVFFLNWI